MLQGEAKGRLEGRLELVVRQLRRRLGRLSREREKQVRAVSAERLEGLAEALLAFTSPTDLDRWLAPR